MQFPNRPLVPNFLKKLDKYLLMNLPEIWSSRVHLVLYYGSIFCSVLAAICFLQSNDPRTNSTIEYWCIFVGLISFIGIVVYLIYLLRFNVFKRYGRITPIGRLQTFVLYFFAIGTFVLFPFIPPAIESIRANRAYTGEELVNDVNTLNSIICQLEYDSLPHNWMNDTVQVIDSSKLVFSKVLSNEEAIVEAVIDPPENDTISPVFRQITPSELANYLAEKDSLVQLNDSIYILSECPNYRYISGSRDDHTRTREFTSEELFNKFIRHYKTPDKQALLREQSRLTKKYKSHHTRGYYDYSDSETLTSTAFPTLEERNQSEVISESIQNIASRKYRWDANNRPFEYRIFIYISYILALLVFIFRHTTTKIFFLSLLTSIILLILTSLIISFSNASESSVPGWLIFYSILFLCGSIFTWKSKKRNIISGISINLFTILLSFIPLIVTGYYYANLREAYRVTDKPFPIPSEIVTQHLFYSELLGLLLFLITLPIFIHNVYRKWYALPEQ
jgi:hypothetical protein